MPQRVYWVRRSVVLGVALLLVFGITRLLGTTGADDPDSAIKANTSSAEQRTPAATQGPVPPSKRVRIKSNAPLAPPSGECRDDDVSVVPTVPRAWAGGEIVIRLQLTGTQPACTFEVKPESLVVKIASGEDRIWSSQDCPDTIKESDVVVRSAVPVEVPVIWNGRRSDDQCTRGLAWALPGFYHVYAAALGSTPNDVQFEVTHAPVARKTKTAKPTPSKSASPNARSAAKSTPAAKPSPSAAGSVKGKGSRCGGDNSATSC